MSALLKQYNTIKNRYPDALLLFRVNDYYEVFYDDAKTVSEILDLPLTTKDDGVHLCGFFYSQFDLHLGKLVRAGHRVALCDPLSAPSKPPVQRSISA